MSNCRQGMYQRLFKQWCTAKVLLGCTVYTEILQIPSMLNLTKWLESRQPRARARAMAMGLGLGLWLWG